jgi:uncharacterized protein with PQ loop repeat
MTAISVEQDSTARALVLDAPRVLLVINAAALAENETVNASASIMSNMNMVFLLFCINSAYKTLGAPGRRPRVRRARARRLSSGTIKSMFLQLFGWSLAVASTLTVAPQAVRLARTGNSAGVSATSAALGFATMLSWCHYTATIKDVPALASSLGPAVVWGFVLSWVLIKEHTRSVSLQAAIAVSVAIIASYLGLSQYAAVLGSLTWVMPQTYRSIKARDLTGVSATAYSLVALENVAWIIYAVGTRTVAYAVAPLVQAPLSAVIAYRAATSHAKNDLLVRAGSCGHDVCSSKKRSAESVLSCAIVDK